MTLSPQAAGNTIVLGGRKGSPREWVLWPLSHIQCVDHQMPGLRACSQGLKSQVRPGVCLHSATLANTFLGQHGPPHGEGGSGSASEGAGCHAGVTWPSHLAPPMCPRRVVAGQPLACPMREWGAKLALAEEANNHGRPLEADTGLLRVRAPWVKNANWGP